MLSSNGYSASTAPIEGRCGNKLQIPCSPMEDDTKHHNDHIDHIDFTPKIAWVKMETLEMNCAPSKRTNGHFPDPKIRAENAETLRKAKTTGEKAQDDIKRAKHYASLDMR